MADLHFLNLDAIGPNEFLPYSKTKPSKIIVLGKPGTGKSHAILSILHHMRKRIGQGIVISGTEDTNAAYAPYFPSLFIYNKYSETPIRNLITRQKELIRAKVPNPWSVLVIDDCAYDKKFWSSTLQEELFKNSRHWYILYILAIQYVMDIPRSIRAAMDGAFIFREHNKALRKIIYENYASIIPTWALFNELMDTYAVNHGALFVNNMNCTDDWRDSILYYKAPILPIGWKFGSREFNNYGAARGEP